MKNQERTEKNKDSAVYKIPCGGCSSAYYGETSRGVATRIREHKNDMRLHKTTNSMVVHAEEYGHLPDWANTEILHAGLNRLARRTVEAAYIVTEETTNHKEGFIKLARAPAGIIAAAVRSHKRQSGSRSGITQATSPPMNQPVTCPNPRQPVR